MPCVDMPIEELKVYGGINPRPDDFDVFWESSLCELKGIDPQLELISCPFPSKIADMYDVWFNSTKGARIHGRVAIPKDRLEKLPAIVHFHGLSGSCDRWNNLLIYASQGYVTASLDCRGQGGLSQDVGGRLGTTYSSPFIRGIDGDPHDLLARDLFLDAARFVELIMSLDSVDPDRVGVHGGSQGGGLSIAAAALVKRVKLCAASYPYMSDYMRVWQMGNTSIGYEGIRYWFRNFDPLHKREHEFFTKLGYIDIQHLAPRIRAKVRMATGLMDTSCPPSTQFAVYNKIKSEKSIVLYPDFGHEYLIGDDDEVFRFMSEL